MFHFFKSVEDVPEDLYLASLLGEDEEMVDDEDDLIDPDDDDEDFWDDTDIE